MHLVAERIVECLLNAFILIAGDWLHLHYAKEHIEEVHMHSRSADTDCRILVWAESTGQSSS